MNTSAPGGGAKLSLMLLGLAVIGVWLLAPDFFRGSGGGVCGLSLKFGPGFQDVTVQRVDRRDEPRVAAAEKPLAVPCGEDLEVRWEQARPKPGNAASAPSGRDERGAPPGSAGAAARPGVAELRGGTQLIPAARLKPGSVVEVELR